MAIEAPHPEGWAALGFGSGMIDTDAVIATSRAGSGGIGVFNLGDYSASAIREYPQAVAGSRRLAQTTDAAPGFTISDVRPRLPLRRESFRAISASWPCPHSSIAVFLGLQMYKDGSVEQTFYPTDSGACRKAAGLLIHSLG